MVYLVRTGMKTVIYSPTQSRVIDKVIACTQDSQNTLRNIITNKAVSFNEGEIVETVRTFPRFVSKV